MRATAVGPTRAGSVSAQVRVRVGIGSRYLRFLAEEVSGHRQSTLRTIAVGAGRDGQES